MVAGHPNKGLFWHFLGSGKSLLMLFAARKLRLHPASLVDKLWSSLLRASGPTRVKLTCHRLPPSAWHAATPAWHRGGEARPHASHTRRGGGRARLRTRHA